MTVLKTQPILVCMVWRGGARLARCLESIERGLPYFARVIVSVTSEPSSPDMTIAQAAQEKHPEIEVICTGRELPTMQHQVFWIDHLLATGARPTDWVCWLSYDDELRVRGIRSIVNDAGDWPLVSGTAYFGPWAMRGEDPDALWDGNRDEALEAWTSFPAAGPTRLPVATWISDQLDQPTYMQMSGSVNPLQSFIDLKLKRPRKRGPMRIEMATASASGIDMVEELPEPICIIYGRSDSDRASYGKSARREDRHLAVWLLRYGIRHPRALPVIARSIARSVVRRVLHATGGVALPREEWRVRSSVQP